MSNQNQEGTFQGANGLELYYQSWHPPALGKAVLIIIPGHGGHSGIFTRMVKYLLERNYIVYAFDLRGNGRSPGQRGYINNWSEFRVDLIAFLNLVTTENPNLPLFIIGQSLGGTIALDYALREPNSIKGLILMSPALGLGVAGWKIFISKPLSAILPHFALNTGIDIAACSRDPKVVTVIAQDPLRHRQGTARLATELLKTIEWINIHATELKTPLLLLYGGADRAISPESCRTFFARLTLVDKEIREYPESYHELHHDLNYQEVLADMEHWIDRHQRELGVVLNNE